jgi:NAD(P)H dehydrogenase (quinone)
MGNILVLYDTNTGHTRCMAEYVAQGASRIPGIQLRLKSLDDADSQDILWCHGLALGSPTHLGGVSWRMKRFWDELVPQVWGQVDGKLGCAFSSSGGWGGGAELACQDLLVLLMNFGFLTFGVTDYVADKFTLHYGAVTAGEPRQPREIDACLRLGERLAQWVAVYADGRGEHLPAPMKER